MSPEMFSAWAPGRVELLGNHTDYNGGVVLGAAIDRGLMVRGWRRDDERIAINSAAIGAIEIDGRELRPDPEHRWASYVLGVASELRALGLTSGGFSIEITGDLPARAGLSSSAAIEVGTALFLLKLSGQTLPPLEIARSCQRAEHRFAGIKSGLLDQIISLFGKRDHAVFFDCRSEEVRTIPFPAGFAIIIADSGQRRDLSSSAYNLRREETHAAARALGVAALRDISLPQLATRSELPDLLRRRARHVVAENQRVLRSLDFLVAGNGAAFGRLLNESHESSRDDFENSTGELDQLVAIAQQLPGVLGARLTGAGFGGAAIVLCERADAEKIASEISSRYEKATGIRSSALVSELADGAR